MSAVVVPATGLEVRLARREPPLPPACKHPARADPPPAVHLAHQPFALALSVPAAEEAAPLRLTPVRVAEEEAVARTLLRLVAVDRTACAPIRLLAAVHLSLRGSLVATD